MWLCFERLENGRSFHELCFSVLSVLFIHENSPLISIMSHFLCFIRVNVLELIFLINLPIDFLNKMEQLLQDDYPAFLKCYSRHLKGSTFKSSKMHLGHFEKKFTFYIITVPFFLHFHTILKRRSQGWYTALASCGSILFSRTFRCFRCNCSQSQTG